MTLEYLAVFSFFAMIYAYGCAPGILWQDSGLIQYRVFNDDTIGFFGLALSHPLYYGIAIGVKSLWPGGFPWTVNLLSALFGALTVANIFLLLRLWIGTAQPALMGSLCLGFAHTFWRHACIAETYCLWSFFFSLELILLLLWDRSNDRRYGLALAFVNGLALSVHMLALLPLCVYLVYTAWAWKESRIKAGDLILALGCWICGSLPILFLFSLTMVDSSDFIGTFSSLLFGTQWQDEVLNSRISWAMVQMNLLYVLLNFPSPLLILLPIGVLALWRRANHRRVSWSLLGIGLLFLVFAFRYNVPDRYAFFLPFYIAVAICIAWGTRAVEKLVNLPRLKYLLFGLALIPTLVYASLPIVLGRLGVDLGTRNDVPYRDDLTYFIEPWKRGYQGADRFAHEALVEVEDGAVIFSDLTSAAPLLLVQQQKALRPDVAVICAVAQTPNAPPFNVLTIQSLLEERPVYVVSNQPGYCPAFILKHYSLERGWTLWRVSPN